VKVSVVLPTYCERDTILALVGEIQEVLKDAEIVVVDDDSPDRTWAAVEEAARDDPRLRVIRRIGRRGLPGAIAEGLAAGAGESLVWLDADGSMPPKVIPDLIGALEEADVAVASRYVAGGEDARESRLRIATSRILNLVASTVLSRDVRDYTSGFVAIRREALERVPLRTDYVYGDYCIDFLYRACRAGLRVREIPYRNVERQAGETKTASDLGRFVGLGVAYLKTIFRLRLRG
jgi:glycosyltransferase involved in cell wall biosynthesis